MHDSVQNLRKGNGDKMPGVMCLIDAIGYESWGIRRASTPMKKSASSKSRSAWRGTKACRSKWVIAGIAKPSIIVSQRLPLEAAPDAYAKFHKRVDGYTNVLLKPQQKAVAPSVN
jgi:hypothetical protein